MTPRATDWSLALLVALAALTGALTIFAGGPGQAWVFTLHGAGGLRSPSSSCPRAGACGGGRSTPTPGVLPPPWSPLTLLSGVAWASGGDWAFGGFRLLFWHDALGAVLPPSS